MTKSEMDSLPLGSIIQYKWDTPWDGAICELVEKGFPRIKVKIIVPGKNGSMKWNVSIFGYLAVHKFVVCPEDVSILKNSVLRKIKDLDYKFKTKSLRKVKVEKLPLGA